MMLARLVFSVLFFLAQSLCFGQVIPPERLVDWSNVGLQNTNHSNIQVLMKEMGADPTGMQSNDVIIQSILAQYPDTSVELFFEAGDYLFQQPINLTDGMKITGENSSKTSLLFDLENADHLLKAKGQYIGKPLFLNQAISKYDSVIVLDNNTFFEANDVIQLFDNDEALVESDWAKNSTGQICRIDKISGDSLFLSSSLRRDYLLENSPYLRKIDPIENASISNLKIVRMDETESQTSNIFIDLADNCQVSCIESYNCNFAHLDIRRSLNIEVFGSYFQDAFDYGNGGKAYGVALHFAASNCLVFSNHFNHLRHSMLLQAGANGNVLSYNYSQNPFWSGVLLPSNSAGDLVLHGNYPYANLLEGNVVQNIVIDDSHGSNGPYNTFLRNRGELYGFFMNNKPASNQQNFIGNEVSNTGILLGFYNLAGEDHFEYGNNIKGTTTPVGTSGNIVFSLYLDLNNLPSIVEEANFPFIGFPYTLDEHQNPTQAMASQNYLTACTPPITAIEAISDNISSINLYPNPAKKWVHFEVDSSANIAIESVEIYNQAGQLLLKKSNKKRLKIAHLDRGIYFVKIYLSNGLVQIKKLLHF